MSNKNDSGGSNKGLGNSIEDVKLLVKGLESAIVRMKSLGKYEDALICLGSTRSGKSTLVNYLIGNKLIGEKVSTVRPVSIKQADDSLGPPIGIGPTSETVFPSRWNSRQSLGLPIWDVPGFDDNRGVVQDITNAFYINELFKILKSAKILLVTDINDIVHDNTRPFLSLLDSVEKLLKEKMGECSSGIVIVFSKVPTEIFDVPVDKKYINDLLDYQFLSSTGIDMSQRATDLIRYWTKNEHMIGFFKQADIGAVTDDAINEGIFEAVKSAHNIEDNILKQVSPSISETSRLFLYEVREELCSTEIFLELQSLVKDIYKKNFKRFESVEIEMAAKDELDHLTQELTTFKKKLSKAVDTALCFDEKINAMRTIDSSIDKLVDKHNLVQRAKFMKFVDDLLGFEESKDFEINLQIIMTAANRNIEELILCTIVKMKNIDRVIAEAESMRIIQELKEESEKLEKQKEEVEKRNEAMRQKMREEMEIMADAETSNYRMYQAYMQAYRDEREQYQREKYQREERARRSYEREQYEREQYERDKSERQRKERARIEVKKSKKRENKTVRESKQADFQLCSIL